VTPTALRALAVIVGFAIIAGGWLAAMNGEGSFRWVFALVLVLAGLLVIAGALATKGDGHG
jgi:peptidoglycan/LPS O-acetylase OafA/YrhL